MSWSGTCYCSYCGDKGHNRRTCTERRTDEEITLKEIPESMAAARILKRREHEKRSNKMNAKDRACTYCTERGHNRRGCPLKKRDRSLLQKRFTEYRKAFAEEMQQSGIGIGALVRFPVDQTTRDDVREPNVVGLVTRVHWDAVSNKYQDADLSSYGVLEYEEIDLVEIRVVSSDVKEGGWRTPPHPGMPMNVRTSLFAHTIPDVFLTTVLVRGERDENRYKPAKVEVLSPAPFVEAPEGFFDSDITKFVLQTYNIEPAKGGSKSRLYPEHLLMKALYPENEEEMEKE